MTDRPIFSVSEFHEMINVHLARLGEIVVEGEISELKESGGKWLYVTISDSASTVKLFGTLWELKNWRSLEVGMKVHAYGTARTYAPYGTFSLTVSRIEPAGEGALKVAFERLKKQLEREGLFDVTRKRTLPQFPKHIGLITAKDSQAYNDFTKVLKHRMGGLYIYFVPVTVQGASAPAALCNALKYLNQKMPHLDALVVCRGGGSLEDLQAFNDEAVVRAIFASSIPVISGVGHEGDITLTDLVADVRASTPSNSAELLVKEREHVLQSVDMLVRRIHRVFSAEIAERKHNVDSALTQLEHKLTNHVSYVNQRIEAFYNSVDHFDSSFQRATEKQKSLSRLLTSLDYNAWLRKGFSMTYTSDGKLIRSIHDAPEGSDLSTHVTDGTIYSHVTKTTTKTANKTTQN